MTWAGWGHFVGGLPSASGPDDVRAPKHGRSFAPPPLNPAQIQESTNPR
jgi:hypothetical protein